MKGLTLLEGTIEISDQYSEVKKFVLGVFDNEDDLRIATEKFNKLQKNFRRAITERPININTYIEPYR